MARNSGVHVSLPVPPSSIIWISFGYSQVMLLLYCDCNFGLGKGNDIRYTEGRIVLPFGGSSSLSGQIPPDPCSLWGSPTAQIAVNYNYIQYCGASHLAYSTLPIPSGQLRVRSRFYGRRNMDLRVWCWSPYSYFCWVSLALVSRQKSTFSRKQIGGESNLSEIWHPNFSVLNDSWQVVTMTMSVVPVLTRVVTMTMSVVPVLTQCPTCSYFDRQLQSRPKSRRIPDQYR